MDGYESYRQHLEGVEMREYAHMPHHVADMLPERCTADILDFLRRRCSL